MRKSLIIAAVMFTSSAHADAALNAMKASAWVRGHSSAAVSRCGGLVMNASEDIRQLDVAFISHDKLWPSFKDGAEQFNKNANDSLRAACMAAVLSSANTLVLSKVSK